MPRTKPVAAADAALILLAIRQLTAYLRAMQTQATQPQAPPPLTIVEVGRRGGLGRAKRLSPARRKAIARKAARVRWSKKKTA